jgi:hypothetical protein
MPKIGDMVIYYQGDYEAYKAQHGRYPETDAEKSYSQNSPGTNGHREHPAIVTAVWGEGCVNLHVFFDAVPSEIRTSALLLPEIPASVHCTNSGWHRPRD